jgi:hypothetical protein
MIALPQRTNDFMKTLKIFGMWLAFTARAIAGDIGTFDVGGVRLGMSPREAKAAVQAKCQRENGNYIEAKGYQHPFMPGAIITLGYVCEGPIDRSTASPLTSTTVKMIALPAGKVVVEEIVYRMTRNAENTKSLRERATERYGNPTNINGDYYEWCNDPEPLVSDHPVCRFSKGPNLRIEQTILTLSDPGYGEQARSAHHAKSVIKPSL